MTFALDDDALAVLKTRTDGPNTLTQWLSWRIWREHHVLPNDMRFGGHLSKGPISLEYFLSLQEEFRDRVKGL